MDRRFFLESSVLGAGTWLLSGFNQSTAVWSCSAGRTLFACEGGIFGKDSLFVLGYLCVDGEISVHENYISNIRNMFNYHTKFRYNSNDKYKINITKELNKYFYNNQALSFYAIIKKNTQELAFSPKKAALEKISVHKELMEKAGINGQAASVIVKSQSPFGPSNYYISLFKEKTGGAAIAAVNTVNSNLLQFAGTLTGSVRQDLQKNIKDSSVKKILLDDLKNNLSRTELVPGVAINTKFIIFE